MIVLKIILIVIACMLVGWAFSACVLWFVNGFGAAGGAFKAGWSYQYTNGFGESVSLNPAQVIPVLLDTTLGAGSTAALSNTVFAGLGAALGAYFALGFYRRVTQ